MSFLPANYEAPSASGFYMKLQDGENKIRIMSQPILGWEDWENKKPVRFRMENKPLSSIDPDKPVKHFWSFVVWNYNEEKIQVLHITQATVRKAIQTLCEDSDWGAPYGYDIKIFKSGKQVDTEYKVNPLPHKYIGDYVIDQFYATPCWLEALFTNDDPFSMWHTHTACEIKKGDLPTVEEKKIPLVSKTQLDELESILKDCDPRYKDNLLSAILKPPVNAKSLSELPAIYFPDVLKKAKANKEQFSTQTLEVPF